MSFSDLENFLSVGQHHNWLVSPIWACSSHFHEMTLKQLLFLNKFATTLFKGAHSCKIPRLDFLNSQTKTLYRSSYGQTSPEGKLVNLVNMNSAPLITLCVVKVYYDIINHSTHLLHQLLSITYVETNRTSKSLPLFQNHVAHVSWLCCKAQACHVTLTILPCFNVWKTQVASTCCTTHIS
jgi:hypothetical protein